jgi:hypothetical protein
MNEFYSRIGLILSGSDYEGSHHSVAESMASGVVSVIRNWEGASDIYGNDYVFESVDEAVQVIRN